ncbi:IS4 family transposase [Coraliomargarita algicola]|uniref:IS4 family transposase n=1 Tax=Coraliomargarita algicola TaxID=3092156 RepID=A0ABZ0RRM5_9BACT|nr:IS4 family transposase [Coraliomargarita sp. J2-16]WPJ98142.1 IS4 family transposase [Coraliomargarita sp. J2-16]
MSASTSLCFPLFSNFPAAFEELFSRESCALIFAQHGPRGGGQAKLNGWEWLMSRVYHELARSGTFSSNTKAVSGVRISDSALSQRALSIGEKLIEEILPIALRPLADRERDVQAFYHAYRLVAIDGTRFNLRNTGTINEQASKVACNRGSGEPAFAHLLAVVLVELGMHQPLGTRLGWQGEGELTLARQLFAAQDLPERSLLLADRLFGYPSLIWGLWSMLRRTHSYVLVRIKSNLKAKRTRQLADGSWLVEVKAVDPSTRKKVGVLELREIYGRVCYEDQNGHRSCLQIRLWTSLLDDTTSPATELIALYAARWEEELFFRELKSHLHARGELLDALTPQTAAQEVLAMLLAAALIAKQRQSVASAAGVEPLRISFAKVLHKTAALCELLQVGADLITPQALAQWIQRLLDDLIYDAVIKKRRPRTCPRTLRQPTKDWPKTKVAQSKRVVKTIEVTNP